MATDKTISRREFLANAGRAAAATWLGAELLSEAQATPALAQASNGSPPLSTNRGILQLHLQTMSVDDMRPFYAETIGFEVEEAKDSLLIQAGGTLLRFDKTAHGAFSSTNPPVYHIAWAIPTNKFGEAKAWLSARTPLLRTPEGRDEFHFRRANRRAVYFADPGGNILELIARDDLEDTSLGAFGLEDILYVNHVGMAVDDMDGAIATLKRDLGLALTATPSPSFAKLGDAHRHLTLVTRKRLWLPEYTREADVFPLAATLHGEPAPTLDFEPFPYRISIES